MIRCTIDYGHLRLDWDSNGTLTIARSDTAASVQLSLSEWEFLQEAARLRGWPVSRPVGVTATSPS